MNQSHLTEDEWFAIEWSPDELRATYNNESVDMYRREHAFFRYWNPYLKNTTGMLSEQEVAELVKFSYWSLMIGSLVGEMAVKDRLDKYSILKLLTVLPSTDYAGKQMLACLVLKDDSLTNISKVDLLSGKGNGVTAAPSPKNRT